MNFFSKNFCISSLFELLKAETQSTYEANGKNGTSEEATDSEVNKKNLLPFDLLNVKLFSNKCLNNLLCVSLQT